MSSLRPSYVARRKGRGFNFDDDSDISSVVTAEQSAKALRQQQRVSSLVTSTKGQTSTDNNLTEQDDRATSSSTRSTNTRSMNSVSGRTQSRRRRSRDSDRLGPQRRANGGLDNESSESMWTYGVDIIQRDDNSRQSRSRRHRNREAVKDKREDVQNEHPTKVDDHFQSTDHFSSAVSHDGISAHDEEESRVSPSIIPSVKESHAEDQSIPLETSDTVESLQVDDEIEKIQTSSQINIEEGKHEEESKHEEKNKEEDKIDLKEKRDTEAQPPHVDLKTDNYSINTEKNDPSIGHKVSVQSYVKDERSVGVSSRLSYDEESRARRERIRAARTARMQKIHSEQQSVTEREKTEKGSCRVRPDKEERSLVGSKSVPFDERSRAHLAQTKKAAPPQIKQIPSFSSHQPSVKIDAIELQSVNSFVTELSLDTTLNETKTDTALNRVVASKTPYSLNMETKPNRPSSPSSEAIRNVNSDYVDDRFSTAKPFCTTSTNGDESSEKSQQVTEKEPSHPYKGKKTEDNTDAEKGDAIAGEETLLYPSVTEEKSVAASMSVPWDETSRAINHQEKKEGGHNSDTEDRSPDSGEAQSQPSIEEKVSLSVSKSVPCDEYSRTNEEEESKGPLPPIRQKFSFSSARQRAKKLDTFELKSVNSTVTETSVDTILNEAMADTGVNGVAMAMTRAANMESKTKLLPAVSFDTIVNEAMPDNSTDKNELAEKTDAVEAREMYKPTRSENKGPAFPLMITTTGLSSMSESMFRDTDSVLVPKDEPDLGAAAIAAVAVAAVLNEDDHGSVVSAAEAVSTILTKEELKESRQKFLVADICTEVSDIDNVSAILSPMSTLNQTPSQMAASPTEKISNEGCVEKDEETTDRCHTLSGERELISLDQVCDMMRTHLAAARCHNQDQRNDGKNSSAAINNTKEDSVDESMNESLFWSRCAIAAASSIVKNAASTRSKMELAQTASETVLANGPCGESVASISEKRLSDVAMMTSLEIVRVGGADTATLGFTAAVAILNEGKLLLSQGASSVQQILNKNGTAVTDELTTSVVQVSVPKKEGYNDDDQQVEENTRSIIEDEVLSNHVDGGAMEISDQSDYVEHTLVTWQGECDEEGDQGVAEETDRGTIGRGMVSDSAVRETSDVNGISTVRSLAPYTEEEQQQVPEEKADRVTGVELSDCAGGVIKRLEMLEPTSMKEDTGTFVTNGKPVEAEQLAPSQDGIVHEAQEQSDAVTHDEVFNTKSSAFKSEEDEENFRIGALEKEEGLTTEDKTGALITYDESVEVENLSQSHSNTLVQVQERSLISTHEGSPDTSGVKIVSKEENGEHVSGCNNSQNELSISEHLDEHSFTPSCDASAVTEKMTNLNSPCARSFSERSPGEQNVKCLLGIEEGSVSEKPSGEQNIKCLQSIEEGEDESSASIQGECFSSEPAALTDVVWYAALNNRRTDIAEERKVRNRDILSEGKSLSERIQQLKQRAVRSNYEGKDYDRSFPTEDHGPRFCPGPIPLGDSGIKKEEYCDDTVSELSLAVKTKEELQTVEDTTKTSFIGGLANALGSLQSIITDENQTKQNARFEMATGTPPDDTAADNGIEVALSNEIATIKDDEVNLFISKNGEKKPGAESKAISINGIVNSGNAILPISDCTLDGNDEQKVTTDLSFSGQDVPSVSVARMNTSICLEQIPTALSVESECKSYHAPPRIDNETSTEDRDSQLREEHSSGFVGETSLYAVLSDVPVDDCHSEYPKRNSWSEASAQGLSHHNTSQFPLSVEQVPSELSVEGVHSEFSVARDSRIVSGGLKLYHLEQDNSRTPHAATKSREEISLRETNDEQTLPELANVPSKVSIGEVSAQSSIGVLTHDAGKSVKSRTSLLSRDELKSGNEEMSSKASENFSSKRDASTKTNTLSGRSLKLPRAFSMRSRDSSQCSKKKRFSKASFRKYFKKSGSENSSQNKDVTGVFTRSTASKGLIINDATVAHVIDVSCEDVPTHSLGKGQQHSESHGKNSNDCLSSTSSLSKDESPNVVTTGSIGLKGLIGEDPFSASEGKISTNTHGEEMQHLESHERNEPSNIVVRAMTSVSIDDGSFSASSSKREGLSTGNYASKGLEVEDPSSASACHLSGEDVSVNTSAEKEQHFADATTTVASKTSSASPEEKPTTGASAVSIISKGLAVEDT